MIMWIARDSNGDLNVYEEKPIRSKDYFGILTKGNSFVAYLGINSDSFPEVTWENSPKELVIKED